MKQKLSSSDLLFKLDVAGYKKFVAPIKPSTIGQGTLQFTCSNANIHIHTCDLIETQHFSSTAELDACLSINILLKGKVKYQLSQQEYEFSTTKDQPIVFVNAINQSEIFTRFMAPEQQVKKVNISCNKQWLFNRCVNQEDIEFLNKIFVCNEQVTHWIANEKMLKLAKQLIENIHDKSLENQFSLERMSIEILQLALSCLKKLSHNKNENLTISSNHKNATTFLGQVNDLLEKELSLEEVANSLAMSVSTLQRKFKTLYNMTVIDYHRQKKLNQSREHLTIDRLSIGETSYLAGYKHVSNFSHAFKKQFRLTPHEFLQQHKIN